MKRFTIVVLIGLAAGGVLFASAAKRDFTSVEKNKMVFDVTMIMSMKETLNRAESNKQIVKAAIRSANEGDFDLLEKLYSPRLITHLPGGKVTNNWKQHESACRWARKDRPTLTRIVEEIVAEGDKVGVRVKRVATWKEAAWPADKGPGRVEVTLMKMYRIEDGKIIEEWIEGDSAWLHAFNRPLRKVTKWN